jgi:hypothetical protein
MFCGIDTLIRFEALGNMSPKAAPGELLLIHGGQRHSSRDWKTPQLNGGRSAVRRQRVIEWLSFLATGCACRAQGERR